MQNTIPEFDKTPNQAIQEDEDILETPAEETTEVTQDPEEDHVEPETTSSPSNEIDEELANVTFDSLIDSLSTNNPIERPAGTVETGGLGVTDQQKARFHPRGNPLSFVSDEDARVMLRIAEYVKKAEAEGIQNFTEEELNHFRALHMASQQTMSNLYEGLDYRRLNEREGAQWRNGVFNDDNRLIGISMPKDSRPRAGEAAIGGIRAVDLLTETAGLGRRRRVSLPHSGFWVSFKTPTLDSYLELTKALSQEKIELGRRTRGAIFSSEQVYIHEMLTNYAIRHIIDTNAPSRFPEDLKKLILLPDMISLIWGLMCTHWPNGYRYQHACTATDDCTYVVEDLLNVARLYWVDNSRITALQRRQLTSASREILTYETLRQYREDTVLPASRYIPLDLPALEDGASIRITLRVPTLEEDAVSGHNWVDGIDNISVDAFTNNPLRGQDRLDYIAMQARVTELLKYMHWIENFEYTDAEGNVTLITDRTSIQETLKSYNGDEALRDSILEGIRTFITDSVVAVVGFPNFECPHCKKAANTENSISQLIAPIDVISAFFIQCQEFLTAETQI